MLFLIRSLKLILGFVFRFLSFNPLQILQSSDSVGPNIKWFEDFKIGSVIEAKVQESKEYGIVVNIDKYDGVKGFIAHYQCKLFLLLLLFDSLQKYCYQLLNL